MASDSDSTTSSSSDSEVMKKPAPVTKNDSSSSSDSESDKKPAPVTKKESSSSSDSESDKKPTKKESSSSDSSDSESDKKPAKKESSSDSSSSESDKKPAKKESSSDSSDSESDKKPAKKESSSDSSDSESDKKPAKKESSDSDSSDSDAKKKVAKKVAKKAAKKSESEDTDSDSESEDKKKSKSDSESEEEEEEKPKKSGGFQGWLEQRRQKKRENENIEFSQKVIKNWIYKRDGALAKKVCYEGMLPYTRIMSWNVMIGTDTRISKKLYTVNVKNGKGLREKFTKNPDAPTDGNEKTILMIPKAVKEVYPNESSFHDAKFEASLQEVLETFVAYRPDIGYFDGLNYVAAMLLQFQDPETVFTSVVNLFLNYVILAVDPEMKTQFEDYCAAFMRALEEEVPDVAGYFQEKDVSIATILKDWMGSLYARTVAYEKSKRIWDILLLEGPFGIIKIGLGILKMYSDKVTDLSANKIYPFLSHLPEKVNIDDLAASIKSVNMANVDWEIILKDVAENRDGDASPEPQSDSEDEKPAPKKVEDSDSEEEKPAPKKVESSSSDSSSEDEKPAPKKVESSSSDSSSEDEKPAPKPAPKESSSSSSSSDSSSEDEKPAPKPAPKESSSSSSSSEDEKPAPKPAPKKDSSSSSSSSSSSDDEKPAPKPAPKKVESSSSDSSSSD